MQRADPGQVTARVTVRKRIEIKSRRGIILAQHLEQVFAAQSVQFCGRGSSLGLIKILTVRGSAQSFQVVQRRAQNELNELAMPFHVPHNDGQFFFALFVDLMQEKSERQQDDGQEGDANNPVVVSKKVDRCLRRVFAITHPEFQKYIPSMSSWLYLPKVEIM